MKAMGIEIPLRNIHAESAAYSELVAGGGSKQVPCLRIEHGPDDVEWLYESGDIIRYLKKLPAG